MGKRLLAAGLWFVAVLCLYELAWSLAGAPRALGPILATGVAAFVAIDPMHLLWTRLGPGAPRAARSSESTDLAPHLRGLTDPTT